MTFSTNKLFEQSYFQGTSSSMQQPRQPLSMVKPLEPATKSVADLLRTGTPKKVPIYKPVSSMSLKQLPGTPVQQRKIASTTKKAKPKLKREDSATPNFVFGESCSEIGSEPRPDS
jgi:hypothetical protein